MNKSRIDDPCSADTTDRSGPGPQPFIPIGQYQIPAMPTQQAFQRWLERLRHLVYPQEASPFVADDALHATSAALLDRIVAPPPIAYLHDELNLTLKDWLREASPDCWVKLIVLPPGDEIDCLSGWAKARGLSIIDAPDREAITADAVPDLTGLDIRGGALVIPNLERWFLRREGGLAAITVLLDRIDGLRQHCVVGCNSWAWRYLSRAVGADHILPDGLSFVPYDAGRLRCWLGSLARAQTGPMPEFRLADSGTVLLGPDMTDQQGSQTDWFSRLAAKSLGIPWVAWHLWRRSLRGREPAAGNHDALWVVEPDDRVLPGGPDQSALLILHALLIHGPLRLDTLYSVLPGMTEPHALALLRRAGFIESSDGLLRCRAAAYPAIRKSLAAAGFPMDRLG